MTRYTNAGRKRKYLESDKEIEDREATKKVKVSAEVDGEDANEGQTAQASTSKMAEHSEIKNAYKNRDKNRQSAC